MPTPNSHDRAPQDSEEVDLVIADPGGVPFDDDADERVPRTRAGASYDGPEQLTARGIAYPQRTPVGMNQLRDFVVSSRGGSSLGCLSVPPRSVRAGTQPSLHNWGIAWDWSWAAPGPGRAGADALIEFLLANKDRLGIQAVHDYAAGRYWKSYAGWRNGVASASTGMGQPWARWLHIERSWSAANDQRSIEALLGNAATPAAVAGAPAELPAGQLMLGSRGADVARVQDFLQFYGFADFTRSDGVYGPRTKAAITAAQTRFAALGTYLVKIDGNWGPKTAAAASVYPSMAGSPTPAPTSTTSTTSTTKGSARSQSTAQAAAPKKWTFMVWIAGDNNLENDAINDLNEMKQVGSNADINIVAQCDRMSDSRTHRYLLREGTTLDADKVQDLGETNTGDPAVASDFFAWAIDNYPAQRYAVVIWNHGSGIDEADIYAAVRGARRSGPPIRSALFRTTLDRIQRSVTTDDRGIGYDDTNRDFLDNAELRNVLASVATRIGKPIDLVGFDACLMAMFELGYEMREIVKVVVGSEEVEPGAGWPYDRVLGRLASSPSMTGTKFGAAVVDEYMASYPDDDVTQSATNLKSAGKLSRAVDSLAKALLGVLANGDEGLVSAAAARTAAFENVDFVDLVDFARNLAKSTRDPAVIAAAADVERAAIGRNGYVIANGTRGERLRRATGAAIYFPSRGGTQVTYDDLQVATDTRWGDFLEAYALALGPG